MPLLWEPKARMPDAVCPDCSCPDFVLTGKVFRSSVAGQRRETGSVCICCRCTAQFYISLEGVKRPDVSRGTSVPDGPKPQRPGERPVGPSLADSDQPWGRQR